MSISMFAESFTANPFFFKFFLDFSFIDKMLPLNPKLPYRIFMVGDDSILSDRMVT